jgi:hypothetical protein
VRVGSGLAGSAGNFPALRRNDWPWTFDVNSESQPYGGLVAGIRRTREHSWNLENSKLIWMTQAFEGSKPLVVGTVEDGCSSVLRIQAVTVLTPGPRLDPCRLLARKLNQQG